MKKNEKKNLSVSLNPETSLFFAHLIKEGLAEYKQDPNMEEGKIEARLVEDKKGKKRIHVTGFTFIILAADDD